MISTEFVEPAVELAFCTLVTVVMVGLHNRVIKLFLINVRLGIDVSECCRPRLNNQTPHLRGFVVQDVDT